MTAMDTLVERIATKAKEMGGVTDGADCPIVRIYFVESAKRGGRMGWNADVPIKRPHARNRYAMGKGHTMEQALLNLAKGVGL